MLFYLTIIFLCQLAGEVIVGALALPLPGPVLGMVILFAYLALRRAIPEGLAEVAGNLQKGMSLLFVPAGAGVILHLHLLAQAVIPLGVALLVSTLLAVLVTGFVMVKLGKSDPEGQKPLKGARDE